MMNVNTLKNMNLGGYVAVCGLGLLLTLRLLLMPANETPSSPNPASTANSAVTETPCANAASSPSIANEFQLLPRPTDAPSAHAASGDYDQDGTLMAVWFAGSREGARSVKIFSAQFQQGAWTAPRIVTDSYQSGEESGYFVKNLGNPTLIFHQHTWWLFYVGVSAGGWSGSRLYVKHSRDGINWSPARQLVNNAFFNLSTLVRNVPLLDGDNILLPAYHELAYKNPEYLLFSPRLNRIIDRYRPAARGFLQPALVRAANGDLHVWLRASPPWQQLGLHQMTQPAAQATTEPNPNSSVAALALGNGCDLLAFNPQAGRSQLWLRQWCLAAAPHRADLTPDFRPLNVESGQEQDEYSYPTLLQHGDKVDVLYTWKRQTIAHRRYTREALLPALASKNCH